MENVRRYLLVHLLLGMSTLLPGARIDWKPPAQVALPQTIRPATGDESGWKRQNDLWVLKGRAGIVEAPAWWTGNRPPRGELVVLEVEYKDDFKKPVVAEIYSGLGTSRSYSEIHCFGGTGEGAWTRARIPVTSDFIFVYEPAKTIRFRLLPADGTLTAKGFRLVAPLPDEEERYNAATRAWVKRVQERADIAPRYYKLAQTPVVPGEWGDKPLVPYTRNWMDLVRPISAPQPGEAGASLQVRMFLNEYESAQLGVYANGQDLKNVRVEAAPIRDSSGNIVAEVAVRVAEYAKVKGQMIPGYLVEPFPQRLWPAYAFDVSAGRSHPVWFVVRTQEGTANPGKYATTVKIEAEGVAAISVALDVEILGARLLTMEEAGLKLGGCTRGLVPEFELEFLREYNHNMVNIWYTSVRPELSKADGSFAMDFRIMDDWMAAAVRSGISDLVYFLGGNPYSFPRTMHLPRTLAATVLGLDDKGWKDLAYRDPNVIPEEVAPLMVEWTRRFGRHARENNWPNVILTPFDEPAKYSQYRSDLGMMSYIKPQFKRQTELLRKGDPKAEIYGSIHQYNPGMDFLEDVDIFCTNAVHENWNMPDEVRAAGKTLWEYTGTSDKGLPGRARYSFGYYFAAHDSRGSLVWAYNWGNRFDTLDGSNWMYAWNTPFDVISTPYMEGLREAWDDRRLIETLKQTADKKGVDLTTFFGRLFGEIAAARGQGGRDTVTDFWQAAKNDFVMDEWRDRMVQKLMAISSE
jgi:hypothetical protein